MVAVDPRFRNPCLGYGGVSCHRVCCHSAGTQIELVSVLRLGRFYLFFSDSCALIWSALSHLRIANWPSRAVGSSNKSQKKASIWAPRLIQSRDTSWTPLGQLSTFATSSTQNGRPLSMWFGRDMVLSRNDTAKSKGSPSFQTYPSTTLRICWAPQPALSTQSPLKAHRSASFFTNWIRDRIVRPVEGQRGLRLLTVEVQGTFLPLASIMGCNPLQGLQRFCRRCRGRPRHTGPSGSIVPPHSMGAGIFPVPDDFGAPNPSPGAF